MTEHGDGELDGLVASATGWDLAPVLASLAPAALSAHDLVTAAQACQKLAARVEALQTRLLAELATRPEYTGCSCPPGTSHVHRAVQAAGDEISLALSWSPGHAANAVAVADELVHDLPDTLAALEAGAVDATKARLITERTRCLTTPAARRSVEAAVLPHAGGLTRTQLDRRLRREIIAAEPAAAEHRRHEAARLRRVHPPQPASPGGDDGSAILAVQGPAEDVAAIWTAVNAAARHAKRAGDDRTMHQLRFDALAATGWAALAAGHLACCNTTCHPPMSHDVGRMEGGDARSQVAASHVPARGGPQPLAKVRGKAVAVNVTVAATTLAGADDLPGWLDGYGPITAGAARRLSMQGFWRRLLTDPVTGHLLDYGRTVYSPPADLAAFVAARDGTCRFPTCHHPARETDVDHRTPYHLGGATNPASTWALHRGHHITKTHHGHTIRSSSDGQTWWVTPAGHAYLSSPEPITPDLSPPSDDLGPPNDDAEPPDDLAPPPI